MIVITLIAIATAVAIVSTVVTVCSLFAYQDAMDDAINNGLHPNASLVQDSQRLTARFYLLVITLTILVILLILFPVIIH